MISFVIYELPTGRIVSLGSASNIDNAVIQTRPGCSVLCHENAESVRDTTHFVSLDGSQPSIAERPVMPGFNKLSILADGEDTARLELGQPFSCLIDGESHEVADGVLEITSSLPARYSVSIRLFPFQDYDAEITACA